MKRVNIIMLLFAFVSILFITTSYSAFNTNLYVSGSGVLRAHAETRIEGVENIGYHGNAIENYNPNYNVDITNMSVDLPNSSDYVTYKVKIKNYGNEVFIPQIELLSDVGNNVIVTISDGTTTYNLPNNNMDYKLNTNELKEYTVTIKNKTNTTNNDVVVSLKYHFVIDEVTNPVIALDTNEENIELVTPGTSTFGVDHYEYYVSETNVEPSSSATASGTTSGTLAKSSINLGHFYIWYRTVSEKGTKSEWSNSVEAQNSFTLTYNTNGGSSCSPLTANANTAWGTLCIPTKSGYRLEGWFTDNNTFANEITSTSIATSNITVYAKWVPKTLYGVLENEYNTNTGFAKLYTGEHQDSMDASKSTHNIYHWYGSTDANGTAILDKNNVVFANQCWQMIRTTDTGGVRMIYNGEPTVTVENGETKYDCSDSRPGHIGGIKSTQSLSGSYYYGDGYTTSVSGTTTTYTLTNPTQVTVNSSNAATEIPNIASNYPYTCRSTSATGTCTTLYKVDSQSSGATAYVYESTYRDMIGTSVFNSNNNSVGDVGYMYNSRYPVNLYGHIYTSVSLYSSVTLYSSVLNNYGDFYFGDGYTMSGNNHVLSNAVKGNTIENYPSSWVGKYICLSSGSSSCGNIVYVGSISTSGTYPIIYITSIESGKEYNDPKYRYLFGDSITDNGNGTFEISGNVEEIIAKDWNNKYNSMRNKFVCMPGYYSYDSVNDKYTCSDNGTQRVGALRYVTSTTISTFSATNIYKYGYGITASGSNYKLIGNNNEDGTLQYIYNWPNTSNSNCFTNSNSISDCGYKSISRSHYTCYNLTGVCSTYSYIYYTSNTKTHYASITGGKYVSTDLTDTNNILYEMLKVNTVNSTIKENIDVWYRNVLLTNYDNYIDDTIYCNNRTITNFGGWNPNGGTTAIGTNFSLSFTNSNSESTDLSCTNVTDRFSVSNNNAKLTYKVAVISYPELNLLRSIKARTSASYYRLSSPSFFSSERGETRIVMADGRNENIDVAYTYGGLRPAISLIPGIEYVRGNGRMESPYIVE